MCISTEKTDTEILCPIFYLNVISIFFSQNTKYNKYTQNTQMRLDIYMYIKTEEQFLATPRHLAAEFLLHESIVSL